MSKKWVRSKEAPHVSMRRSFPAEGRVKNAKSCIRNWSGLFEEGQGVGGWSDNSEQGRIAGIRPEGHGRGWGGVQFTQNLQDSTFTLSERVLRGSVIIQPSV